MKPRRVRIRLTLGGLMALVACLAVFLGWQVNKARQQRETVAVVKAHGGWVEYDWQYVDGSRVPTGKQTVPAWLRRPVGDEYFQQVVRVYLPAKPRSEDLWASLKASPGLRFLRLQEGQDADSTLARVADLGGLETLIIGEASFTPRGLAHLAKLKHLKRLDIRDSELGDDDLAPIGSMTQLERLDLAGVRISNAGVAHLRHLTHLRELFLRPSLASGNPGIDDTGLETLTGLTNLKELWVGGSAITPEGVRRFQAELPNLKTVH